MPPPFCPQSHPHPLGPYIGRNRISTVTRQHQFVWIVAITFSPSPDGMRVFTSRSHRRFGAPITRRIAPRGPTIELATPSSRMGVVFGRERAPLRNDNRRLPPVEIRASIDPHSFVAERPFFGSSKMLSRLPNPTARPIAKPAHPVTRVFESRSRRGLIEKVRPPAQVPSTNRRPI